MAESPTNGASPTLNAEQRDRQLNRLESLIGNVLTSRAELFRQLLDPRRDIDDECGYPPSRSGVINPAIFQELYDREAVAARVVEVLPRESWQVQPIVYEDDSSDTSTPFEEAWDELATQLRGESSFYKDSESSPVWEYLRRADELSGIGQYGIILLGIDDGLPLDQPVQGFKADDVSMPYPSAGTTTPQPDSSGLTTGPGSSYPTGQFGPSIQGADAQYFQSSAMSYGGNLPQGTMDPTRPGVTPDSREQDFQGIGSGSSSIPQREGEGEGSKRHKLLFLRVFPESLVQVTRYESRPTSARFGQPVMYLVTFNDPKEQHGGVGLPIASMNVHWSRVIHIADVSHQANSSEVFAVPRMRPVLNRLLDLRKLYSGSAEMFWKGAFPGMSLETNPQLGGDVDINISELRDMWEEYQNGLQRALFLTGMTAKTLAPTVSDPTAQIDIQITAICIKLGIPKRVFMGSERGELASSQDDQAWNDRLRERQSSYITPRIIVPFIDRLIAIGVLPKPTVSKPAPQVTKPFALKPQAPPPNKALPVDENGEPIPGHPLAGAPMGGGNGPSTPGTKPPFGGKPPVSGGKPAFPHKPSFNRSGVANAFPPTDKLRTRGVPARDDPSDTLGRDSQQFTQGEMPAKEGEETDSPLDPNREQDPNTLPPGITPDIATPPQKPQKPGYRIEWPDLTSQSDSERATVANTRTTALAAYISGGVDELVPPLEFLTKIMGIDEDEAQSIIDAAAKAQEEEAAQQQPGEVDPLTGEPIPPELGPDGQPLLPGTSDPTQPPGMPPRPSSIFPMHPEGPPTATPDGIAPKSPLVRE